jgi:hypothetical protein
MEKFDLHVNTARLLGRTVAEHLKLASLAMPSLNMKPEGPTNVVVVVGGLASLRRFQSIATLIPEVNEIFVGGELCIPLLMAQAALPAAVLACHSHLLQWKGLAAQLLSETHRFGTKLHLPTELVLCHDDRSLDELKQLSAQMTMFDELDIEVSFKVVEQFCLVPRSCSSDDQHSSRLFRCADDGAGHRKSTRQASTWTNLRRHRKVCRSREGVFVAKAMSFPKHPI